MFFYWNGNKLSWLRYMSIYSFKKLNPEWKITLYTSPIVNSKSTYCDVFYQDFDHFGGDDWMSEVCKIGVNIIEHKINYQDFDDVLNPVFKSDISRWQLLAIDGGFYADSDILFIKPMSSYLDDATLDMYDTIVCLNRSGHCMIGFMAASENNVFYADVIKSSISNYNEQIYESMGGNAIERILVGSRGRGNFSKLENKYQTYRFKNLDMNCVYPFKYSEHPMIFDQRNDEIDAMVVNSIGIHWFGATEVSSKFNNIINPSNIDQYDNILTKYIKNII